MKLQIKLNSVKKKCVSKICLVDTLVHLLKHELKSFLELFQKMSQTVIAYKAERIFSTDLNDTELKT